MRACESVGRCVCTSRRQWYREGNGPCAGSWVIVSANLLLYCGNCFGGPSLYLHPLESDAKTGTAFVSELRSEWYRSHIVTLPLPATPDDLFSPDRCQPVSMKAEKPRRPYPDIRRARPTALQSLGGSRSSAFATSRTASRNKNSHLDHRARRPSRPCITDDVPARSPLNTAREFRFRNAFRPKALSTRVTRSFDFDVDYPYNEPLAVVQRRHQAHLSTTCSQTVGLQHKSRGAFPRNYSSHS